MGKIPTFSRFFFADVPYVGFIFNSMFKRWVQLDLYPGQHGAPLSGQVRFFYALLKLCPEQNLVFVIVCFQQRGSGSCSCHSADTTEFLEKPKRLGGRKRGSRKKGMKGEEGWFAFAHGLCLVATKSHPLHFHPLTLLDFICQDRWPLSGGKRYKCKKIGYIVMFWDHLLEFWVQPEILTSLDFSPWISWISQQPKIFRDGAQSNGPELLLQAGPGDENQFKAVSMEINQNISRWQQNTYTWTCWWTLSKRWFHLIYL